MWYRLLSLGLGQPTAACHSQAASCALARSTCRSRSLCCAPRLLAHALISGASSWVPSSREHGQSCWDSRCLGLRQVLHPASLHGGLLCPGQLWDTGSTGAVLSSILATSLCYTSELVGSGLVQRTFLEGVQFSQLVAVSCKRWSKCALCSYLFLTGAEKRNKPLSSPFKAKPNLVQRVHHFQKDGKLWWIFGLGQSLRYVSGHAI